MNETEANLRVIGHWTCPPPPGPLRDWSEAVSRIAPSVQRLLAPQTKAPGVFGLELRCAFLAIQRAPHLPSADNDFWQTKSRVLFTRPAVEPIAISFAERFRTATLGPDEIRRTVSMLAAQDLHIRQSRAIGRSRHGDIVYEPPDQARDWLESFPQPLACGNGASEFPVYLYAKSIMAHPFTDANGRFARLMFATALAVQLGVPRACLAFAPSFYRFAEKLSLSLTTLSETGEWKPLTCKLIEIVDDAAMLTGLAYGLGQADAGW